MDDVKIIIDRMKVQTNSRTYQELAEKLGIKLSAINSWKRRGFVPEKNLLKCVQMTNTPLKFFEEGSAILPLGKNGKYADYQLVSENHKKRIENNNDLTPDIENIVEILKEMNTNKRRDVLRYVLEISSE